ALLGEVQQAVAREPLRDRERDVLAHALRQQETLVLTVLRHEREPDPGRERLTRRADRRRTPADLDLAVRAQDAEEREEELELALALESADAEDLALVQVEVDPAQPVPERESADAQGDALGRGRLLVRVEALEPAAEHQRDDLILGRPRALERADVAPVAED